MVDRLANILVFPDDTMYAPGFSEKAFGAISLGEKGSRVLEILGEPFSRRVGFTNGNEYWSYSKRGIRHKNYWIRIVVVNPEAGKVVGKVDELYSD
jgi:hypothetical protein